MNYIIFMPIMLFVFMVFLMWKEIVSIVFPYLFIRIELLKSDNSLYRKIFTKNTKSIKFNKNEYFLQDNNPYYEKGMRKYYFKEGDRYPINFREIKLCRNVDHETKFFEKSISDMLIGKKEGFSDFMKEYGNIIILCVLAIIGLMIYKNQNVPT